MPYEGRKHLGHMSAMATLPLSSTRHGAAVHIVPRLCGRHQTSAPHSWDARDRSPANRLLLFAQPLELQKVKASCAGEQVQTGCGHRRGADLATLPAQWWPQWSHVGAEAKLIEFRRVRVKAAALGVPRWTLTWTLRRRRGRRWMKKPRRRPPRTCWVRDFVKS